MRSRFRTCTGTTVAFAVAFTALGASPAWADPVVEDRPPVSEQLSLNAPSGTDPRQDRGADPRPPDVADVADLERDAYVAPFREARSVEYFAVSPRELPREAVAAVRAVEGVEAALSVDAARVEIDG
ncbi:peptidoglycan endopeptidase, partial [Nocardiopsis tropica]|nr:peptidoglycan endopeptidase [Nocardiopsis tropica]